MRLPLRTTESLMAPHETLHLKVLLPNEILLDRQVIKVIAEAANGYFCLLPRHVDCVAALVPGLLSFVDEAGSERFVAVDEGTLVKCAHEVLVSTRNAVVGRSLGALQEIVQEQFRILDERQRMARSATARLEAGLVRRFLEFDRHGL